MYCLYCMRFSCNELVMVFIMGLFMYGFHHFCSVYPSTNTLFYSPDPAVAVWAINPPSFWIARDLYHCLCYLLKTAAAIYCLSSIRQNRSCWLPLSTCTLQVQRGCLNCALRGYNFNIKTQYWILKRPWMNETSWTLVKAKRYSYQKGPAHPHKCFHLLKQVWRLKVEARALLRVCKGPQNTVYRFEGMRTGAIKLTRKIGRCQSSTVCKHPHSPKKTCNQSK